MVGPIMMLRRVTATAGVVLFAVACSKDPGIAEREFADQYAVAYCERYVYCDCVDFADDADATFADEDACFAGVTAALEEEMEAARAAKLEYDPGCAERLIDRLHHAVAQGCLVTHHEPWRLAEQWEVDVYECALYHGDAPLGGSCIELGDHPVAIARSCKPGLSCLGGECTNWYAYEGNSCAQAAHCLESWCQAGTCVPHLPAGEACNPVFFQQCDEGLYCHSATEPMQCRPKPKLGEECFAQGDCERGAWCDGLGGCQPRAAVGEACSAPSCIEGAFCDAGVCAPFEPAVCGDWVPVANQ